MSTSLTFVEKLEFLLTTFSDSANKLFKEALLDEIEKQQLGFTIEHIEIFTKQINVVLEKDGVSTPYRIKPCTSGSKLVSRDGVNVIEFKDEVTSQIACVAMTTMSTFSSYYS